MCAAFVTDFENISGTEEGMVDMQARAGAEALLLGPPLSTLQGRLAELLHDWPDHPILMQLDALTSRILGAMPIARVHVTTCSRSLLKA